MLMSDKVGILSEKIITDRREHYIVVKRINHLRSIKILNVDTPNKRVAIHVKQKKTFQIMVGDSNTLLLTTGRTIRQKRVVTE